MVPMLLGVLLIVAGGAAWVIGPSVAGAGGKGRAKLLGLGLMFFGLRVMSDAMAPLKGMPQVAEFFVAAAQDPLPALLVATVFTAIVQASAATIGLVLGLSFQGILTLDAAIPFVLGANVGTAATAVLASLTADAEGRRVAWAHAAFRAGGVLLLLPFLGPFARLVQVTAGDLPRQIANAHTLLNLGTALVFLPTIAVAARIFRRLVPDRPEEAVFAPRSLDPYRAPRLSISCRMQVVKRGRSTLKLRYPPVASTESTSAD